MHPWKVGQSINQNSTRCNFFQKILDLLASKISKQMVDISLLALGFGRQLKLKLYLVNINHFSMKYSIKQSKKRNEPTNVL
jgi:hypothetical protein